MKKILPCLAILFLSISVFSQSNLSSIVSDGIKLHDKGDYKGAIQKYDQALAIDSNHFDANYEKAYSLSMLEEHKQCIAICRKLSLMYPNDPQMKLVYVTWGSALDYDGSPRDALAIYDKGIADFPDYYLLHYNKAITYAGLQETQKSIQAAQTALLKNSRHASSHNLLGILLLEKNKIASLLSSLAVLAIEPTTNRATTNLKSVQQILAGNASKENGQINVNISAESLSDSAKREDNFSTIELMMTLTAALDFDEKFKNEDPTDRLERKLSTLVGLLWESREDAEGYYWEHYVPFFHEMEEKKLLNTFSHIAFASQDNKENNKWLDEHEPEIEAFYTWLQGYVW